MSGVSAGMFTPTTSIALKRHEAERGGTNAKAHPHLAGPNGAGKTTFAREFLPD
jgi:hypothetical protein